MAVFDLSDPNPGVWFDFTDGARVKIRVFNQDAFLKIRKACVKQKVRKLGSGKNRTVETYEDTNEDLMREMLRDYVIVAWEGIEDANGNAIECTIENKNLLMDHFPAFQRFVDDAQEQLGLALDRQLEDEEKN